MCQNLIAIFVFCSLPIAAWAADKTASTPDVERLTKNISLAISQLNDDRAADRESAEKKLLDLGGKSTAEADRFLKALPRDTDQMPVAVRERLARIRRLVEDRAAKAATGATTITLSAKAMPLKEAIAAVEKQTGNKFVDNREQQGDPATTNEAPISIELKDEPFWSGIDQIFDQAKLGIYSYGGKDALAIVGRDSAESPRYKRGAYSGPFRLDITDVQAQRNLRQPKQTSLKLQLEIAWEPRLRPIAISQPVADVEAMTDDGNKLAVSQPEANLDVEIPNGTQAAEISLPFTLPPRTAKSITKIHGKMHALVPGRQVKFRFDDLAKAAGKTQQMGGVKVTLDDVRKNNAVWEVHMRVSLDEDNGALQSHRAWVFQNLSYLLDKDGKQIENGGLETTRQSKNEVGNAYVFDVPSLDGTSWIYETPAAIVDLPVDYEIKNIQLP